MLPKTKIPDITPLEFCRQIKSIDTGWTVEQVELREEHGTYKEYCSILARELEVPFSTIQTKWGPGTEFPGMPRRVQKTLKFVLVARKLEIQQYRRVA